MVVTASGTVAGDLANGDIVDSVAEDTFDLESAPAMVLGLPVNHGCQEVETASGAKCVMSNNALVYIYDPSRGHRAVVNCQRIGPNRIAVLIDGLLYYEPAVARPWGQADVVQTLVPGGALIAGREANKRILITTVR